MNKLKLGDGYKIPKIGFGTWQLREGQEAETSVAEALKAGYRLIDTASIYGNERSVGKAIRESGIPREDIFLTTKIWTYDFGYDSAHTAFAGSLERLGLEYIDLYLIHWPGDNIDNRHAAWRALIEMNNLGTVKSIGVSNFKVEDMERLFAEFDQKPVVNQIELHPFLYDQQAELLDFCAKQNIVVEAYSPLAQGQNLKKETIQEVARAHSKSPAQVMLRWAIAHGTVPIPRSGNRGRIRENLDVFDFELSRDEMEQLDSLGVGQSVI